MGLRTSCLAIVLLVAANSAFAGQSGPAQFGNMDRLGKVHFPVSCSPAAQKQFDAAMAEFYSFWFEESEKDFAAIAQTDPHCAMAWWGVAMSDWHELWSPPEKNELEAGLAAVEKAKAIGTRTEREAAYVAAIATYYKDSDKLDHKARAAAYENAMHELSARFPDDHEAAILYALSLLATASPTDKSYAHQKQAGAILERLLPLQPDHPGITHFIIHSYDDPVLAPKALAAARAYAKIAPAVPHALHMPSHIFVRLGLWQEAIESNLASAAAARDYEMQIHMNGPWDERLHAMDYLEYAYVQSGREDEARRVAEEASALTPHEPGAKAWYPIAAIPARFTIERRHWAGAAMLAPRPGMWPAAEAITWWARAIGAAHLGDADAVRANLDKVQSMENELLASRDSSSLYWAGQVGIQRREVAAWLAHLEGKNEKALALMRDAANTEDLSEKSPMTPGPVVPAREMLGGLLLELKQPSAALVEYETSLKSAPNRLNGLYGAARAAQDAGQSAKAREYFGKIVEVCQPGDAPELRHAHTYLAVK